MSSDCSAGLRTMGSLWWHRGNLIGTTIKTSMPLIIRNVVMFFDVCAIILRNEAKCIKTYTGSGRIYKRRDILRRVCQNLYIPEFMQLTVLSRISNIEKKNGVENNDNMF